MIELKTGDVVEHIGLADSIWIVDREHKGWWRLSDVVYCKPVNGAARRWAGYLERVHFHIGLLRLTPDIEFARLVDEARRELCRR